METTYFTFLHEIVAQAGQNITGIFQGIVDVNADFRSYHQVFLAYSSGFGVGGWIFYIAMILIVIGIVGCLFTALIYLIRRTTKHIKDGMNINDLQDENERLHLELYRLQRLELGSHYMNTPTPAGLPQPQQEKDESLLEKRFPRLSQIDEKYPSGMLQINIPEEEAGIDLAEICARFQNFACNSCGLFYSITTVRSFISSLGASKLLILEGISGTGKTSLPYAMGRFFQNDAHICAVQPSWRDKSELIGYYNDFTKRFFETEFLCALYESNYNDATNFIVLDEVNLARIEYYFADILSLMETPNKNIASLQVIPNPEPSDPKLLQNGSIKIPQNLYFIGTANNDESTFSITDKVYDRAMVLEFEAKEKPFQAPISKPLPLPFSYLETLFENAKKQRPLSAANKANFDALLERVFEMFGVNLGNRVMKQIESFVPCYVECGGTETEALDFLFRTKIMKKVVTKMQTTSQDAIETLDKEIVNLFGDDSFIISRSYLQKIRKGIR